MVDIQWFRSGNVAWCRAGMFATFAVAWTPSAFAGQVTNPPPRAPTLSHELILLAAGAIFGALLGPVGQAILSKLLPSDDLRLRREELDALRKLISTLTSKICVESRLDGKVRQSCSASRQNSGSEAD